jgi:aryl-alcohol dehydrogenase-like predicted oxidoreductase
MDYRFLGRTGVRISRLGCGTMSFGGDADEATSAALFARAREAGVNWFDCADVYNGGRAETILGQLVAPCRDEVVLTTKAYFPTGPDQNARGSSRYHLVRAVEASLRRLATDRIDLFFLHRHDDVTDPEETLRALDDLVRAGKILYVGASNFAAWQVAKALGIQERRGLSPFVCVQPMYNLLKRQAEVEILPHAAAEGLAVTPYSPMAGGLLSGKYGRERRPDRGRLVTNQMYQVRYGAPSNYEIAERFSALAREWGHHPAALAIAWVASHPAVTAPLLGARDLAQLEVVLGAADLSLDAEQRAAITALSPTPAPSTDRNEETSAHNYGAR